MMEKKFIIEYLKKSIQSLLKYIEERNVNEIIDCTYTFNLCSGIEAAFLHKQLKYTSSIFGKLGRTKQSFEYEFWNVVQEIIPRNFLENFNISEELLTNVGYGRLWIRYAINESTLLCYLETLCHDHKLLNKYYSKDSLMRDAEMIETFCGLLRSIEHLHFKLDLNSPLLNTWVNSDALKLSGLDMTPTNLVDFYSDLPSEPSISSDHLGSDKGSLNMEGMDRNSNYDYDDEEEVISKSLPVTSLLRVSSPVSENGLDKIHENNDDSIEPKIDSNENEIDHDVVIATEINDHNDEEIYQEELTHDKNGISASIESQIQIDEIKESPIEETPIDINIEEPGSSSNSPNQIEPFQEYAPFPLDDDHKQNEQNGFTRQDSDKNSINVVVEENIDIDDKETSIRSNESFSKNWENHEEIDPEFKSLESSEQNDANNPLNSYPSSPIPVPESFDSNIPIASSSQQDTNESRSSPSSSNDKLSKVSLIYNKLYASTSDLMHQLIRRTPFYNYQIHSNRYFPFNKFVKVSDDDNWEFLGDNLLSKTNDIQRLIDLYPGKEFTNTMDGTNTVFGGKCFSCQELLKLGESFVDYYDGNLYCKSCESNTKAVIPKDVICNWDFTPKPVSETTKRFLSESLVHPNINLSEHEILFDVVPELARMRNLRHKLCILWGQITSCDLDISSKMRKSLYPRDYMLGIINEKDLYSLEDLIMLRSGVLEKYIRYVIEKIAVPHVINCAICKMKALHCDSCRDKNRLIFQHEIDQYTQCTSPMCMSVVHNDCKLKSVQSFYCRRCVQFLENQQPIATVGYDTLN